MTQTMQLVFELRWLESKVVLMNYVKSNTINPNHTGWMVI